jgi:hypothetical protein
MRERAALLGGTFAAGLEDTAGPEGPLWTVRASLPVTEEDRPQ